MENSQNPLTASRPAMRRLTFIWTSLRTHRPEVCDEIIGFLGGELVLVRRHFRDLLNFVLFDRGLFVGMQFLSHVHQLHCVRVFVHDESLDRPAFAILEAGYPEPRLYISSRVKNRLAKVIE